MAKKLYVLAKPVLFEPNEIFYQLFSLPFPIIKYMYLNPCSTKGWKKLILTCKYFFYKNSIYPICNLEAARGKYWKVDGKYVYFNMDFSRLRSFGGFNVDRLHLNSNAASLLASKICQCKLQYIRLSGQNLTWTDYQELTSCGSFKLLHMDKCTIAYSDGSMVTFDKLIDNLQNLEEFEMGLPDPAIFEEDTVEKMVKILPRLQKLRKFSIFELQESFAFSSMIDFLLSNHKIKIRLTYDFQVSLSNAYKKILGNFIAEAIENPPKNENLPYITFPGIDPTLRITYLTLRGVSY